MVRRAHGHLRPHVMRRARPPEVIDRSPGRSRWASRSIKIFTTDVRPIGKGRMIRMGHLWAIMERAARHGGILAIHAEDDDLVMHMYERLEREGQTDIRNTRRRSTAPCPRTSRSTACSGSRATSRARRRLLRHVSARAGVDAIGGATWPGLAVYGETLHHYASFTADATSGPTR